MAEVVVGIDFGSSGSGFAYAFIDNQEEIIYNKIFGANIKDIKVPTEIILDNNNEIISFGAECKQYISNNGLIKGKNYYIKDIKRNLYEKNTKIQAYNSEKIFPLTLIIQRVLEKLKDLAITEIKICCPYIQNQIKYVVALPAFWESFQKTIMMEASINAGLIREEDDKTLFFVLESEAVLYYCLDNKYIDQNLMKEDIDYIICDLGGTNCIISHFVGNNENMNKLCIPIGSQFGSNEINKIFYEEIILKIFGCKDFNSYYEKYKYWNREDEEEVNYLYSEWNELERQVNVFKEETNLRRIEENDYFPINFSLFRDIFNNDEDLNILVEKYNNDCNYYDLKIQIKSKRKWIINFPFRIIYNYIKKQVNSLCKAINYILNERITSKMILVGGYSKNDILISEIKKQLSNKISYFLQPSSPDLSIMAGAVLFGLNPNKIRQRKADIQCILKYQMDKTKIKLFGNNFFKNNKNKCHLIINGKKVELCEFYEEENTIQKDKIINIQLIINEELTDLSFMFSDCSSLLKISDISKWNTKSVTRMNNIFSGCKSLLNLPDISNWDVSNVTDMNNMFSNCSLINYLPDISKWNTKNVVNMNNMFYNCSSLLTLPDLSKWNTGKVKDMSCMFSKCKSLKCLPDISKWNISEVIYMNEMFSECLSLSEIPDITNWDLKNVNDYRNMFESCNNIYNLTELKLNVIRNEDLKLFPQILFKFNDIENITENMILDLKKEINNLIKEDNFSIIEIKKGSLTVILVLKFIIFKLLKKIKSKEQNEFHFLEFCKSFFPNIKEETQEILKIIKNNKFFTLGSVSPNCTEEIVIDLSNENNQKMLINKILEISNINYSKENNSKSKNKKSIIHLENDINTLDNNNSINIMELSKFINKENLWNMYKKLSDNANEQESNQIPLIEKLDLFNKQFDIDIENALNKSTFEYKIIHIFSVDKEINKYNEAKNRCLNTEQKILFHGTKIESSIAILSTQFNNSSIHKIGIGVYFTDMPDYAWRYSKNSNENKYREKNIPKVGDTFCLVVSEIYYNRSKLETVYNNNKKDEVVPDFGIRCCFTNYKGQTMDKTSLINNNRFIGNEFLITNKNQILPLYSIILKRIEYLVIWRDYNFDLFNPNKYSNKTFNKIQEFHNEIKRKIARELDSKIYYVKTTEEALKLIEIKKYNKIIIITNGNNNAKEFINEARMIIGSPVIAAVSVYNIKRHISLVKEMENTILLNGIDYHEKFLKFVINNDKNGLIDLRNEIINDYCKTIEDFYFQEFNDNLINYPNFKENGNFGDLIYNREKSEEEKERKEREEKESEKKRKKEEIKMKNKMGKKIEAKERKEKEKEEPIERSSCKFI